MPYYFNLPLFTQLTLDQQRAVDEVSLLALSGGPGTGKSVVCLWKHINNHSTKRSNSLLLTYTKTLEHYLKASTNIHSESASNSISRIFWWLTHQANNEYDQIVIDEAQDIKKITFEQFFKYSKFISYGADKRQSIYLSDDESNELLEWFDKDQRFQANSRITLSRNFRNSKEILLFTRSVFRDFMIPHYTINEAIATGIKPTLKLNLGWNVDGQVDAIIDIINAFQSDTHNIAILVPFQKMVDPYFNAIRGKLSPNIAFTKFKSEDDKFDGLSGIHITPFKSSKGTEFDTVIIPEFDKYNWILANQNKIESRVTENDYYVAFTRTKTNLFLLCRNGFPNIGDINTITIE